MNFSYFVDLIFPPRCLLCDAAGCDELDLCRRCLDALPHNQRACTQCALPLPSVPAEDAPPLVCGKCLRSPPVFDSSISLFEYEQDAARIISQLKFNDRLVLARTLGKLLYRRVIEQPSQTVDAILPVPLHTSRIRKRGFNQSIELSRVVSKKLGLPMLLKPVKRVRPTSHQTGLNVEQRRKNIKGAFELVKPVKYKHVAIVDDVVTTGSTVNEIARLLKQQGVQQVSVWSIARATLK